MPPGHHLDDAFQIVARSAQEVGRDPRAIGIEGRLQWSASDPATFERQFEKWRGSPATHVSLNTMRSGLGPVDDHIDALASAAEVLLDDA